MECLGLLYPAMLGLGKLTGSCLGMKTGQTSVHRKAWGQVDFVFLDGVRCALWWSVGVLSGRVEVWSLMSGGVLFGGVEVWSLVLWRHLPQWLKGRLCHVWAWPEEDCQFLVVLRPMSTEHIHSGLPWLSVPFDSGPVIVIWSNPVLNHLKNSLPMNSALLWKTSAEAVDRILSVPAEQVGLTMPHFELFS